MKWWKKALIFSGIWIALTVGAGVLHVEVFLKGKTTPEQEEAISMAYGMVCGFGAGMIWAFIALRRKRKTDAD